MEKKSIVSKEQGTRKNDRRFTAGTSVAAKPVTVTAVAAQPVRATHTAELPKMPRALLHIQQSINDARFILALKDNWDDNGAYKVPQSVFTNAQLFLEKYALYILNDLETIVAAPDISPVKDGSIDLEWRTPHARMLVNVKASGQLGYYGDNYTDLNSIKGKIEADPIQKFLAVWMTKLTIE
jgi:hypothetical protein